tara:strand:- start:476 stop:856 length:381 start_codon:yes stop_codon:yes gene_type:complete
MNSFKGVAIPKIVCPPTLFTQTTQFETHRSYTANELLEALNARTQENVVVEVKKIDLNDKIKERTAVLLPAETLPGEVKFWVSYSKIAAESPIEVKSISDEFCVLDEPGLLVSKISGNKRGRPPEK